MSRAMAEVRQGGQRRFAERHRVLLQALEVAVVQMEGLVPKDPVVLGFREPKLDRIHELSVDL